MASTSTYSQPPPNYSSNKNSSATDPLIGRNSWDDEEANIGLPDDEGYKVGLTVNESGKAIRQAFVRKVYGVLVCQLGLTGIVAGLMSYNNAGPWIAANQWSFYVPLFSSILVMFALYWKRQSHPLNILLLGLFTVLESIGIGAIVSFSDTGIVLQALGITAIVFLGLTIFTFQSKWDFSNLGTYLYGAILIFLVTGIFSIFFPFSRTIDAIYAGFGCLIFSGYILFDTWLIAERVSPDDWVLACVSLYLDVINLFLNILRLLSDLQDR